MGQKRKGDSSHQSSVPFKKPRPSNSKGGFKGKRKWIIDTSEKSLRRSVKKMATTKETVGSSAQEWSVVVSKHSKRKRTTSGSAVGIVGSPDASFSETVVSTPSKQSTKTPPAVVIGKPRHRGKKRKKVAENPKTPSKTVPIETTLAKPICGKSKSKSVLTECVEKTVNNASGVNPGEAERLHLPNKPEEVSSNWKLLQATLPAKSSTSSTKPKPKPPPKYAVERAKAKNKPEEREPEIWFDDVDDILIDSLKTKALIQSKSKSQNDPLVKQDSFKGLTKVVAMDCEMVGVGPDGKDSILARVSIVNQFGQCIYDKFLLPREEVTDYRTHVSGIRPADLKKGEEFSKVQAEVHNIMKGRMLVGHALHNDLQVLFLDHPGKKIRDTSRYKPFRKLFGGANPSLKKLVDKVLGIKVQEGEHNSIQDAQAAMRLYTMYKKQWERDIKTRTKGVPNKVLNKNRSPSDTAKTSVG